MDKPVVAHHFLGIDINLSGPVGHSRTCTLSQHKYVRHILKQFIEVRPDLVLRKKQTPCHDS
eukprot:1942371-Pyramimonas_sp.AAC.1